MITSTTYAYKLFRKKGKCEDEGRAREKVSESINI